MNATLTGLTPSRLAHMNATANRAYEIAKTIFGKTEDQARRLYVLGLLHDIGGRYGVDSPHLACARAVANHIKRELIKRGIPTSWL